MFQKIKLRKTDGTEAEVGFMATASTPIRYRQVFHRDFFLAMDNVSKDLTCLSEIAYIMVMQAEGNDTSKCTEEDFYAWLDQFETMELIPKHEPEIIDTLRASRESKSNPKSKDARSTEK